MVNDYHQFFHLHIQASEFKSIVTQGNTEIFAENRRDCKVPRFCRITFELIRPAKHSFEPLPLRLYTLLLFDIFYNVNSVSTALGRSIVGYVTKVITKKIRKQGLNY